MESKIEQIKFNKDQQESYALKMKTEQELREQFEKIKNDNGCIGLLNNEFKWFQKGYSLAQETIKAKDAEIERLKSTFAGYENFKENEKQLKAIAEAREIINQLRGDNYFTCLDATIWLENNK